MNFLSFKEKLQQLGKADTDDLPDVLVDSAEKIYFTWIHKDATNHIDLPKLVIFSFFLQFLDDKRNFQEI